MDRDLKARTKTFALAIIKFVSELPKTTAGFELGRQVLRSATSIGANYRSSQRGRSRAEFISKLSIVQEEADETVFWLELIQESELSSKDITSPLLKEADELTAIFTTMVIKRKKELLRVLFQIFRFSFQNSHFSFLTSNTVRLLFPVF